jgi:3-hydroxyacyl-CoA dehydrogenase
MTIENVAIAGSGIMGSSWAIVYARAGLNVGIYDRNPVTRNLVLAKIADALTHSAALVGGADEQRAVLARISIHDNMEAAVRDADFVHECIEEKLESKLLIFTELDALCKPTAILATTTSSFPISTFATELACRNRCIVVHPATPPHLLPVTEICPAPFTDDAVTKATFVLMERCGQVPVLIRAELPSFVMNRMQGALLVEMFRCLNEGVISPGDIDKIISHGFGLRWAFLGPFEGVDLNAVGGIREYLERFGFIFNNMAVDAGLADPVVTPASIAMLEDYARGQLPLDKISAQTQWRDNAIATLRRLQFEQAKTRI